MRESLGAHSSLVEQYERRFGEIREIMEVKDREGATRVREMEGIIEDQRDKIERQERALE
jgi:hypothetical protein